MLSKFKSIISSEYSELENKAIFLAISGGKDSMTLSRLLLKQGLSHTLLHCNFQLRGSDSDGDEDFLIEYAKKHQLPIYVKRFNTKYEAKVLKLTIQEAARELRYKWFETFCSNNNQVLLTAHHLDDSIETFFINLMRGTGLKGLTGIPKKNKHIYRPLLSFTSAEIMEYVHEEKIVYRADNSNFDNKYLRNELRNNLIPEFEKKTDNFKIKYAETISSLLEVDEWIQEQASSFKTLHLRSDSPEGYHHINKNIVSEQKSIFLEYIFKEFGIYRSNIDAFRNFLTARTGGQFFTKNFIFSLDELLIYIRKKSLTGEKFSMFISSIKEIPVLISLINKSYSIQISESRLPFGQNNILQLNLEKIIFPITIRHWKLGDKIQPLGMTGNKLISDILIDKKIPLHEKESVLVLVDNKKRLLVVFGILISDFIKLESRTKQILQILSNP